MLNPLIAAGLGHQAARGKVPLIHTLAGIVSDLVSHELRALGAEPDGRRIIVEGPEVALPIASVQILALALHKLATKARRYGAARASQ
jgi:hypothetical protein